MLGDKASNLFRGIAENGHNFQVLVLPELIVVRQLANPKIKEGTTRVPKENNITPQIP